jgi:DNA invertase Pin-like site-specific DNA recombinase
MSASHSSNGSGRQLRAAAYYRMSTTRQEDSPERQRSQVRPYCKDKAYALAREYTDEGIAGDVFERRPAFQQLLRDAKAGHFDVIVADEWSRLSRQDPVDFIASVVKPLKDAGVTLDTVSEGPQKWDDLGEQIMLVVKSGKAAGEAKELSRRTITGMANFASKGRILGGAPYGYKTEYETVEEPGKPPKLRPVRLAPDPATAHIVSWMFERYAAGGITLDGLCRELTARGAPPAAGKGGHRPRGGPLPPHWTRNSVSRILRNPKYTGAATWNRRSHGKYHALTGAGKVNGKPRPSDFNNDRAAWVVVAGTHEALVSQATFDAVQGRLSDHARGGRGPNLGAYLFSNLCVCGHCGRSLGGVTIKGRRVYRCRAWDECGEKVCHYGSVAEGVLLAQVLATLKATFADARRQRRLLDKARAKAEAQRRPEALDPLRKQLAELEAKVDHGNGNLLLLPPERVGKALATLKGWEAEADRLRAELADRERAAPVADLEETFKGIRAWLWALEELAGKLDDPEILPLLRDTVRAGVCRIEVRWERRPSKTGRNTRHVPSEGVLYLWDSQGQERGLNCVLPAGPGGR